MGDALATVRIGVSVGQKSGAEGANAQVVGNAKFAQSFAYGFPQSDIHRAYQSGLVIQSTVYFGYSFPKRAALSSECVR